LCCVSFIHSTILFIFENRNIETSSTCMHTISIFSLRRLRQLLLLRLRTFIINFPQPPGHSTTRIYMIIMIIFISLLFCHTFFICCVQQMFTLR
jgi:hypothetical protein